MGMREVPCLALKPTDRQTLGQRIQEEHVGDGEKVFEFGFLTIEMEVLMGQSIEVSADNSIFEWNSEKNYG